MLEPDVIYRILSMYKHFPVRWACTIYCRANDNDRAKQLYIVEMNIKCTWRVLVSPVNSEKDNAVAVVTIANVDHKMTEADDELLETRRSSRHSQRLQARFIDGHMAVESCRHSICILCNVILQRVMLSCSGRNGVRSNSVNWKCLWSFSGNL